MRRFWPPAEAAQADYERLRAAVLAGTPPVDAAAGRFTRGGLAALISHPVSEPIYIAALRGAARPAWTPYADPRVEALARVYRLLCDEDLDRVDQGFLMVSSGEPT